MTYQNWPIATAPAMHATPTANHSQERLPFIVRMTEINVDGKPATNVTELLLGRVAHSYEPIFNSHFAMSCSPFR